MKKIAVLIGSLRQASLNRKAFEKYQQLAKDTFTFEEISIADFPLYNFDITEHVMPKIKQQIAAINKADGILFFTPEYNYSVPGVLKNAIDWLSRSEQAPFNNKKAAIVGVSPGNIGTARMQYDLRKIGVFLNMHFLHKPEVMIGQANSKFNDELELTDEATIDFLQQHINAFNTFIEA